MRARSLARCRTRAHRWLIIDFSDRGETQNIESVLKVAMLNELSDRGVCTPRKEDIVHVRAAPHKEGETLRKMLNALSPDDLPDLITAVIQSNGRFHQKKELDSPHARLHGVADYEFGIPLGVVVNTTLTRNRVADSLAHKVISKLGGAARWILAEGTPDTYAGRSMIASLPEHALIGGVAVVSPDTYASDSDRSTVAVMLSTAAHDKFFYSTAAIDNNDDAAALKLAFKEALRKAVAGLSYAPSAVVLYRSGKGLSESEMKGVLFDETPAVKEVCREVLGREDTPLTLITNTKKHRLRVFPTHATGEDGSGNVPPGFAFDTGLVTPFCHNFFLCPYAGIQGTSTPVHYRVLLNEVRIKPLDVIDLTLALHFACVTAAPPRASARTARSDGARVLAGTSSATAR